MTQIETKARAHANYKSSLGYNYNECKSSFVDGAEWMKKKMIDKACEWLYVYYPTLERAASFEDAWEHFKKAMED